MAARTHPQTHKACARCKLTKTVEEFGTRGPNTHLLRPYCRPCYAERKRNSTPHLLKQKLRPFVDEERRLVKLCRGCRAVKPVSDFSTALGRVRSRCKACDSAYAKAAAATNPERRRAMQRAANARRREQQKRYRQEKKEHFAAYRRDYNEKHREQKSELDRAYRKAFPEKHAEKQARRRARINGAPRVEKLDRAAIIERDARTCYLCGRVLALNEVTLDHVIPLARGGSHTADNLRVCCLRCNCRKHDKLPSELTL